MNTLYMKITGFDARTNSVLVCFASDTTESQNPEDYPAYAFQPFLMWPDITDIEEIKKRIAMAGVYHAEQQEREEMIRKNPQRIFELGALAGTAVQYAVTDIIPAPTIEGIASTLITV